MSKEHREMIKYSSSITLEETENIKHVINKFLVFLNFQDN